MNTPSQQVLRCALLATIITGVTGCIVIKISVNSGKPAAPYGGGREPNGAGHALEQRPNDGVRQGFYTETFDPIGSGGTIIVLASSFVSGNGNQACFPTSEGWDKYFVLPRYFVGPGVTADSTSYTNSEQLSSVTVRTCDPTNGSTLETGIVVYEQFNPNTDKKCATNSPTCLASGKLTIDPRAIANGKKYRATVFYKSGTLSPLTEVKVIWNYP